MKRRILSLGLIVLVAGLGCLALMRPDMDRVWDEEFARTTSISEVSENIYAVSNIRDFTYSGLGETHTEEWVPMRTVDASKITRVWFLTDHFSGDPWVAHTFVSFEFEEGPPLSISIEARREAGEEYSIIGGVMNAYELQYLWGTERDFVSRRLIFLGHPVHMYPLSLDAESARSFFLALVDETNKLAVEPRFYHTLLANCTNLLARAVNTHHPGTLPWDPSWHLTGYADAYLMKEGFIRTAGSQEETKTAYDLTPFRTGILDAASTEEEEFSQYLRELLAQ